MVSPEHVAPTPHQSASSRETKSLLRLLACGSVDDGKSTLMGRLLYESGALYEDQISALRIDSSRLGTRAGELDYALLLDGLASEREQGITIDVAYRFFSTRNRRFIIADAPGHDQYTRNMVTGASTADLAIILIDATKGTLAQTKRHSVLVSLLGIRQIVLAINKMDAVDYSRNVFEHIRTQFLVFAETVGIENVTAIPVSAVAGDNIASISGRTPWYRGPALLPHLETVDIDAQRLQQLPFRFPVQWVNRHADFRGYAGTVSAGIVRPGDRVCVSPSGLRSTVARIVFAGGDWESAVAGQSIALVLSDHLDVSRGDVISCAVAPPSVADFVDATVVWLAEQSMRCEHSYLMKIGTKTVTASVTTLKHKVDIDTGEHAPGNSLALNEIGVATLQLDRRIAFDTYITNREAGGFILIDKFSNGTVAAGMVRDPLRVARDLHWQGVEVHKSARRAMNGHGSAVIWMTGLSGAGKSSLANVLEKQLHAFGIRSYLLDGDNVRHGLNRDLGFAPADRIENVRRIAEVAKLMVDGGLIVLAALISPFRVERKMARDLFEPGEFIEVFIDTPLEVAEARDPKGLYKKARRGELKNFTGIDSPYEPPQSPEIHIDTTKTSVHDAASHVFDRLCSSGLIKRPH